MNEHEMCCGTVADKAKLCAEIAERDRLIDAQQRRIDELLHEIDCMRIKIRMQEIVIGE